VIKDEGTCKENFKFQYAASVKLIGIVS